MCRKITWWKRQYNLTKNPLLSIMEGKTEKDGIMNFRKLERKIRSVCDPESDVLHHHDVCGWICSEMLFNPYFTCGIWHLMRQRCAGGRSVENRDLSRIPASVGRHCAARDVSLLFNWIDAGARVGNLPI